MPFEINLPTPAPGVMFQALDDGAVLFSPTTEIYFGLNHVGARIWELLAPGDCDMDALCERLQESYPDANRVALDSDVRELLGRLAAEGLVTATPPSV